MIMQCELRFPWIVKKIIYIILHVNDAVIYSNKLRGIVSVMMLIGRYLKYELFMLHVIIKPRYMYPIFGSHVSDSLTLRGFAPDMGLMSKF
jgi:hypothetical protein